MKRLSMLLMMAMLAPSLGGCGTVYNLLGPEPRVYGGIRKDMDWAAEYAQSHSGICDVHGSAGGAAVVLALLAVEPTTCLFADTVTLPIAAWLEDTHNAASRASDQ